MTKQFKGVVISDFNADNLNGYLSNDPEQPQIETIDTPFGQVMQILMDPQHDVWQQAPDFAVVWTRPEGVIESYARALHYEEIPLDEVLAEVDAYAARVLLAAERVKSVFVPTWIAPTYERGYGLLDMQPGRGLRYIRMQMNLRLAEGLKDAPNVYLLDAERWAAAAGKSAFNPKLWYMAKVAYGNPVFKAALTEIKAALNALSGRARKLLVLDLDDTLWGGVVGDVGWENVKLGGHDPVGEAFVHFQQELKALTNRGILLAIASKNTESVALEAIKNHPEMVLTEDDFVGWRINWTDKAQNIADLVAELNLGLQSVVFIDDNPAERARVREALPEVFVPEWPEDRMLYAQTLKQLTCFDNPVLSSEDVQRTQMYKTERRREQLKQNVGSLDEWLATLDLQVQVETLNEQNRPRTVQLLNKTNQMNLTTRRLTEQELLDWVAQPNHQLWTFRVSDRFGDQGLTGIASVAIEGDTAHVVDYILSCRVMGRRVEETLVATLVEYARQQGARRVVARYLKTAKNQPCYDFWKRSGFQHDAGDDTFHWDTGQDYPYPDPITVLKPTLQGTPGRD